MPWVIVDDEGTTALEAINVGNDADGGVCSGGAEANNDMAAVSDSRLNNEIEQKPDDAPEENQGESASPITADEISLQIKEMPDGEEKLLSHNGAGCRAEAMQKVRNKHHHLDTCQHLVPDACYNCKCLYKLSYQHAKICQQANCPVPGCHKFKIALQEKSRRAAVLEPLSEQGVFFRYTGYLFLCIGIFFISLGFFYLCTVVLVLLFVFVTLQVIMDRATRALRYTFMKFYDFSRRTYHCVRSSNEKYE